jgi:hypothetical protein
MENYGETLKLKQPANTKRSRRELEMRIKVQSGQLQLE